MLAAVVGDDAVDVIQVWVDGAHRGTRLIDQLFDAVYEWSPRQRIDMDVAGSNGRARAAYARLGFTVAGQHEGPKETEIELTRQRPTR